VIWRGPILANTVKQFWSDVIWGDLDFLLLDMPPGTGDVPLTVFQSLPLDGIVIVTSPQDLVSLIVQKAIHMAQMMKIPIIGLVENMSHIVCPHCGKKISVFGDGKTEAVAKEAGIPYLAACRSTPTWPGCAMPARSNGFTRAISMNVWPRWKKCRSTGRCLPYRLYSQQTKEGQP
jgi:Mrp family chromosome partitioning ATPase